MNLPQSTISFDLEEINRIAFFHLIYLGFQQAAQVAGKEIAHFYDIGGYTICLRFAGTALIPQLTPALAHLATNPTPTPDLTVCLWDSVSTKTPLPLLVTSLVESLKAAWYEKLDPRKEIKGYSSDRLRSSFHVGPNILSLLDTTQNLAVYWLEDAAQVPYYERGSPLLTILNWWTGSHEQQYVHAGAVGYPTGGLLLAGKGGSGKSSTALACLQSSLVYASDDYCLVTADPEPYVYSLYNTAKLKGPADLERFPHLAPLVSNAERLDEEKAMIFLQEHHSEKIVLGFPIRAILLPQVTGKPDTQLQATTAVCALKALAPSTMFQTTGTGQSALRLMSQIVKQVPCYVLELGTDVSQIPEVITGLLSTL